MEDYFSLDDFLMPSLGTSTPVSAAASAAFPSTSGPTIKSETITTDGLRPAYSFLTDSNVLPADVSIAPRVLTSPRSASSLADSESDMEYDDFEQLRTLSNGSATSVFTSGRNSSVLSVTPKSKKQHQPADEDERLLASEEGKKLSSKERRQLRNKVSARHFRLRRKEYITHLEQLVAQKSTEAHGLKSENDRLMLENKRLADALASLTLSPTSSADYLSPSPEEVGFVHSSSHDFSFMDVRSHTPRVLENEHAESQQQPFFPQELTPAPLQPAQRITPRIANLLPTFNSRKDTNPNAVDWPLAYSTAGPATTAGSAASASASSMLPMSNMQVFNTLVPESLAELEKESLNASEQAKADEEEPAKEEEPKKTITVEVLSSKPGKEEGSNDAPKDQEGIWEDARKAAEEVYKRLGVHLAGLRLDDERK
ncbi:hypothetical protein POJ06DRAFT_251897 [Lipomyces tetrasporus]|uniref:BZIP domain-containing protein n=1 Tax=Lipomyces tetrasporus TaxID=54092 RepID=A0AAD7QXC9_9ASCO|nr:uncharacterized protein POJ06DRAFT_251897 [Lipomyces tetrasporus]KAJ8101582.1 hypothetical protein POJ06DRAFT_251897 [Lipomyces tetrasporus]